MKISSLTTILMYFVLTLLVLSVLYFSWLPEPSFRYLSFMPKWLIYWTDKYGRMRTAVPFIPISFIAYAIWKDKKKKNLIFLALWLLAFCAEFVQLFIPHRYFDLIDILWAVMGIILGRFLLLLAKNVIKHFHTI